MVPGALDESLALHRRARALIAAFEEGAAAPEPFDALAVDLARFQARHVPGYGRLCAARGVDPAALSRAVDAPAVPTDAFKLAPVFAFAPEHAAVTFRTSGTTVGERGAHSMRDPATYDAAALAFGRVTLAAGLPLPSPVLVVGPSALEAPDSSLAHMCSLFAERWSVPRPPEEVYFVRGGQLDVTGLRARVARLEGPALLLSTSFGLVHLLDALDGAPLPLPPGSRVMLTGGFKGKSREIEAGALRAMTASTLGVAPADVTGEYGMTELSSQFWDAPARGEGPRVYREPPWARVVAVDPATLAPLPDGQVGLARIEDLANVDSAFAVLTQDRVRRVVGGFELLGRLPGAPPRGCSIALDEMLGGG